MADEEEVDIKLDGNDDVERARIQGVATEMQQLVSRNSAAQALKLAASSFPAQTKDEAIKKIASDAFIPAINNVERGLIDGLIDSFTEEERATVMKYICKSMSCGDKKTCDVLLLWHSKLVAKDGHGIIMRVMADKKV